jgi:hypothetical protein
MVIHADGYVGIGTTTPTRKLEVAGDILIANSNKDGPNIRFKNSANNTWSLDTLSNVDSDNSQFRLFTQGGASGSVVRLMVEESGNVGIGTNSPGVKLDVQYANSDAQIKFGRLGSDIGSGHIGANDENALMVYNGNLSKKLMVVSQNGNVGIGTDNPDKDVKLDVQYTKSDAQIKFGRLGDSIGSGHIGANSVNALMVHGGDLSTQQNLMTISQLGNVGIGTTTPTRKLEVAGDILVANSNDDGPNIRFKNSASNN